MRSVSQDEPLACAPCSDARALGSQRCRSNAPSIFWGYRIKAVGARDAVQASQFNGKQEGESHTDEPNLRCPRNGKQTGGPRHCQGPHFSKFRHWVTPGRLWETFCQPGYRPTRRLRPKRGRITQTPSGKAVRGLCRCPHVVPSHCFASMCQRLRVRSPGAVRSPLEPVLAFPLGLCRLFNRVVSNASNPRSHFMHIEPGLVDGAKLALS